MPSTHIWPCGKQSHNPVRKAHHSHLTHARNQSNMHVQKGSTLIFETCEEPIQHTCSKKDLHLHLTHVRNQSNMHVQKGSALTYDTCEEPIQCACSEGNALTSDLVGTKSHTLAKMAPGPRLSYLVTDQVPPFPEWQFPLHLSYSTKWPTLTSDMGGT